MDLHLIDPVSDILEQVREATGKGIEFIEKENLPTFATLKMARRDMPLHLLYYKREHDELINHLIVHECGHLFRTFKCPEPQRLIPYTTWEIKSNALKQIEAEFVGLPLAENQIARIVEPWYNGLVLQVTNQPPDLFIEKWIFDEIPELRPLQLKSLQKQLAEAVSGLSETIRRITPPTIFHASNIMNYAFFRLLGLHVGHNFIRQYSSTEYIGKGKRLAAMTEKEHLNSHEGDNLMIDKWAAFVNIAEWFQWRGFEDVPADYRQTI